MDITNANVHDVNILDTIPVEAVLITSWIRAIQTLTYNKIHKEQAFFVTRSKDNINFITLKNRNVDPLLAYWMMSPSD